MPEGADNPPLCETPNNQMGVSVSCWSQPSAVLPRLLGRSRLPLLETQNQRHLVFGHRVKWLFVSHTFRGSGVMHARVPKTEEFSQLEPLYNALEG